MGKKQRTRDNTIGTPHGKSNGSMKQMNTSPDQKEDQTHVGKGQDLLHKQIARNA